LQLDQIKPKATLQNTSFLDLLEDTGFETQDKDHLVTLELV
jgi:hypothetical protein